MLPLLLFTDFGIPGPYQGQMKLVLGEEAPGCEVIDLVADAPMMQPRPSAYLLAALAGEIRRESVFVAVVDPGVGGDRAGLVVQTDHHWFVGPDNGLLSVVAQHASSASIWNIDEKPRSRVKTFHGRDWFAPVAAAIACGRPRLGKRLDALEIVGADWEPDFSEVIYVDHYGNLFTGIRGASLDRSTHLKVGDRVIPNATTFCEVSPGTPFWYENSCGLVELAVNQGRADQTLGVGLGESVEIVPAASRS